MQVPQAAGAASCWVSNQPQLAWNEPYRRHLPWIWARVERSECGVNLEVRHPSLTASSFANLLRQLLVAVTQDSLLYRRDFIQFMVFASLVPCKIDRPN